MSRDKEKDKIIADKLVDEIKERNIKTVNIEIEEAETKELGETLFVEITVELTEDFTIFKMLDLNFDLFGKYSLYEKKILFFLHASETPEDLS